MSEPLFLQSVMQEKIWGGTKLRDVFGYEIPSDHVGEYWAISAHPNGVSMTIAAPAIVAPSANFIPATPAAISPIGRRSSCVKRIACPSLDASIT